jgi:group I intron endonuclease
MIGIYQIRNIINNKVYIGSSVNINKRFREHEIGLEKGIHYNKHLQRSWNEYKKDNFLFEILEKVKDKNLLLEREQYWMNIKDSSNIENGYNLSPTAGNTLGYKHTEETKKKIGKIHKGKVLSQETKQKMKNRIPWNKGKKDIFSKECIEKIKLSILERREIISKNMKENNPMFKSDIRKKVSETMKRKRTTNGENNGNSKFTWEDIKKIRKYYNEKILSYEELSLLYGIKEHYIGKIIRKEVWNDE